MSNKYIGLDNGHGKDTAGKRSPDGSLREWYFNYAVTKKMEKKLEFNGFNVLMVSDTSSDTSLSERAARANRAKVDLFVSVHANANLGTEWNSANGIETYAYKSGGSADRLAKLTQDELVLATGRRNRGVKYSNFSVLRNTNMTAILTECGFMDNKEECALLKSDEYREKCATAMVKAICKYYGVVYKEENNSTPSNLDKNKTVYNILTGGFGSRENAQKKLDHLYGLTGWFLELEEQSPGDFRIKTGGFTGEDRVKREMAALTELTGWWCTYKPE